MTVNERIKQLRKALDLTQVEFGSKIGIAQGHLTGLESGKKRITEKTLKVICSVYGTSEKWLKHNEGEMFSTAPAEKIDKISKVFSKLNNELQNYVVHQIETLIELQYKQQSAASEKPKRRKKSKV
ncbi:MAG: helix-turn-helix domain-containing protein [Chitinispirillales bacterium]|jgi:transcriptional regulator with XRE-family HTH domain|nr:helix-turn-helix domain-containing protein [Chitinispirillales bacterium]